MDLAEVIAVPSGAVLRFRNAFGSISTQTLTGKNPLRISTGALEKQSCFGSERPRCTGKNLNCTFGTSAELTKYSGEEIARRVLDLVPSPLGATVYVREETLVQSGNERTDPFVYPVARYVQETAYMGQS